MSFELVAHVGTGLRAVVYVGQVEVRRKFRRKVLPTYRYLFAEPDGLPRVERVEVLDVLATRLRETLMRTRRVETGGVSTVDVLDVLKTRMRETLMRTRGWRFGVVQDRCWMLGTHSRLGVRWEAFDSQAVALQEYERSWMSKVLFDPSGVSVKCCSGHLDGKGAGVATILSEYHGGRLERRSRALAAIQAGEAPFVPPDRPSFVRTALRHVWKVIGCRALLSMWGRNALCYVDATVSPGVRNAVALTIDDAPGRLGVENSMLDDVAGVLREHNAKATFMVMGTFAKGHEEQLVGLLKEGHELGNHGLVDKRYDEDSAEAFAAAVVKCNDHILSLQRAAGVREEVRWFRAPHGRYHHTMLRTLDELGLTNVMCDTFGCCPVIQDGPFIGAFLASHATHGSIVLIHMPEHGFREWCLEGLRVFLEGLDEKGFEVVTMSTLLERARDLQAGEHKSHQLYDSPCVAS